MGKRLIYIFAALVIILTSGYFGIQMWLRFRLRDAVERALDGAGARVETGRLSVNLLRRSVTISDIGIKAQSDDPSRPAASLVSLDVSLESVSVRGVGFDKADGKLALHADRLILATPRATIVTRKVGEGSASPTPATSTFASTPSTSTSAPATDSLPPLEKLRFTLSEKLSSLSISTVEVSGASLELVQWVTDEEKTRLTLDGGHLSAHHITLDSLPVDIRAGADSIVYLFGSGSKTLRADSVALEASAQKLTIAALSLVPQFPKKEFVRRVAGHEDWTRIRLGQIAFHGVDYARLLREHSLFVDSVSLAGADVASFKNRQVYQPPHTRPMLYEVIQRLPIPLDIEVAGFADIDVTYEELAVGGTSPGSVTITGGHGTATNITNIATGNDRFTTIDCTALFMHSGEVTTRCLFPVSATDDTWELYGRLGPTDMTVMNRVTEPIGHLRITSGRIESCEFHIAGTLTRSHSRLTMRYRDLTVAMLDPRDHTRTREFLTVLADGVLVRSNNPSHDGRGHLREATGEATRDPGRSMWNYMWRSLLPAIIKTII